MQTENIPNLVPESRSSELVTPETEVICLNRSRQSFPNQKFDGEDYTLPPGYFFVQMKVARHFRSRLVVPGTRNREDFTEQSFLAILGTRSRSIMHDEALGFDPAEKCVPFSDEELTAFGERLEALDRSGEDVRYVNTKAVAGASGIKSEGRRKNVAAFIGDQQVGVDEVVAPSDEPNAAKSEQSEAVNEGAMPQGSAPDNARIKGSGKGQRLGDVKAKVRN